MKNTIHIGGHYVPITAYTILTNNDVIEQDNLIRLGKFAMNANIQELRSYDKEQLIVPIINFGGFFLGNPYTDFYENAYGFIGDIYGHGLMKAKDWDTWYGIVYCIFFILAHIIVYIQEIRLLGK